MRTFLATLCLTAVCATAQIPGWRRSMMGLPAQPSAATSVADIQSFEQNVRLANPYFATLTPGDYYANRLLMRQMVGYLAAVDVATRNPQVRLALANAYMALAGLHYVYPGSGHPGFEPGPPPPGKPAPPPFELHAREIEGLAPADKETADDLRARYDTSASRAASAWTNAETLRMSLEGNGMTLNAQTATAVARLQLYLELAAAGLDMKDWTEARENLERVEYETQKVFKSVGGR